MDFEIRKVDTARSAAKNIAGNVTKKDGDRFQEEISRSHKNTGLSSDDDLRAFDASSCQAPATIGQGQLPMQFMHAQDGNSGNRYRESAIVSSTGPIRSRSITSNDSNKTEGSFQFQRVALAMGNQYGVDTSNLVAIHNSTFPSSLGADATIQGNRIHFAPGKDTDFIMRHEVAHAIDNTINGTPAGNKVFNRQRIDSTREKTVDSMVSESQAFSGYFTSKNRPKNKQPYQLKHNGPIQRYATSNNGLTVAGEFHDKPEGQDQVEQQFIKHVKGESARTWKENLLPGSDDGAFSEHPEHLLFSGIDRIKYYLDILTEQLSKKKDERTFAANVSIVVAVKKLGAAFGTITADLDGAIAERSGDGDLRDALYYMKSNPLVRTVGRSEQGQLDEDDEQSILENLEVFSQKHQGFNELATVFFNIPEGRSVSHNFIRSKKMNDTANELKGVNGAWMIGQYHVQEIQEHLRNDVKYNLVSVIDFNNDIREFVAKERMHLTVGYSNDVSAAARAIRSSLSYFSSLKKAVVDDGKLEGKSDTEFYFNQLSEHAYLIDEVRNNELNKENALDEELDKVIRSIYQELPIFLLAVDTFINSKDDRHAKLLLRVIGHMINKRNLLNKTDELERLTWTAK